MLKALLINVRVYARMALLVLLRRPYKLTLLLSGGCNLRCQICAIWRSPVTTLTLDEVKTLWGAFRIKPCWINISGGEPTLARDLGPVLSFFTGMRRPLLITVTTNGTSDCSRLLAPILEDNPRAVIYVSVSIDGEQPEHDAARGRPGAFEHAWRTYRNLRALQARTGACLKVGVSTTLSRVNHRKLLPFIQRMLHDKAAMTFNLAQASAYYENAQTDSFEQIPRAELLVLLQAIVVELPKLGLDSFQKIVFLQDAIRFLQGRPAPLRCASYSSNVLVTSELDLMNCTLQFQPWTAKDAPRDDKLRAVVAAIRSPSGRRRLLARRVRAAQCEQGCHSPCEKYIHQIAALLRPWSAPRLLWTYGRACIQAWLVRRRRKRMTAPAAAASRTAPIIRT